MKYELIELHVIDAIRHKNVALIERGEKYLEYAVVRNLDLNESIESDEQWDLTIAYYSPIISNCSKIECLQKAIECYRIKTEENYISRYRLEELATQFKDGLVETYGDDPETSEITDNIIETYELSDYETEFFGLKESEE